MLSINKRTLHKRGAESPIMRKSRAVVVNYACGYNACAIWLLLIISAGDGVSMGFASIVVVLTVILSAPRLIVVLATILATVLPIRILAVLFLISVLSAILAPLLSAAVVIISVVLPSLIYWYSV